MARSTNGTNGRIASGRFAVGNKGGPGNPHARRVAKLRSLLLNAVTDDELHAIVLKLVDLAKGGDLAAIREVLNRTVGKPETPADPDRLELERLRLESELLNANSSARFASLLDI
ncbi:MAG: hypothetical protein R3C68_01580 [Myxococcota bacterium]